MIYRTLPVCFYPTTVLMLDDDINMLDSMSAKAANKLKGFKTFSQPKDALNFIQNFEFTDFTSVCIEQPRSGFETREIYVDIDDIHLHMKNPKRYDEISCIIVDYAMPSMNGSEFCKNIQHFPLKKLMLTGEASEQQGIDAFNKNLIDRFYSKGSPTIGSDILGLIEQLQIMHFQDLSSVIIKSLADSENPPPHCVLDPGLVEPIFNLLKERDIVEYYMYSTDGYFITLDKNGNKGWMTIQSDYEIDTFEDLMDHRYSDEPSPALKTVWDELKNRNITLLFPTDEDSQKSPDQWEKYILKTQKLTTPKTDYYIAFTEDCF